MAAAGAMSAARVAAAGCHVTAPSLPSTSSSSSQSSVRPQRKPRALTSSFAGEALQARPAALPGRLPAAGREVSAVASPPRPSSSKPVPVQLGEGNGLFTNTRPEVRRVRPENPNGRTVVRVVYVVLEAQYQAALTQAVRTINANHPSYCVEVVGYLVEELRDKTNYETFKTDLAAANVFIGSLIFIEEIAEVVKAAVEAERERLDAVLVFPSMPEVMRLNKLGSFSMSQLGQSKTALSQFFKKQRQQSGAGFEESMLKLVRTLPKVLKYLPTAKAQDARNFIMALQFWLGGSPQNLSNMLTMLAGAYIPDLQGKSLSFNDPILFPDAGIWHPLAPCMFEDVKEYLNWCSSRRDASPELKSNNAPVVGLILQRSHLVTGDEGHYSSVIMEMEARGAKVIPIFAGGLDFSGPVEKFFMDRNKPLVDCVLSLTGFALVGGPARQDHPRAIEALKKLNVPYLVSLPLVFQTTEEWVDSTLGLHPVQVALQVALPELDGGIEPIIFSGRDSATGKSHALYDRVVSVATRAVKWAELRKKSKKEKKLAVTVFSFPPDKGNVGTAAYLNVFSSIYSVMKELKADGYSIDLPESAEALIQEVLHDKEAKFASPELNIAYKMPVKEYEALTPYSKALEENWGKAPGTLNTDGQNMVVYGKEFGNLFIGVQPTFGYEGDPMRLLFSKSASPHHGFAAYYTYLEKIWKADAVLHFGTHGSLEFMPGKQVGMSWECYPDSLIGSIPNVYYYAANNPSEATIAKRRSYAATISYLTPPAENAGLYKGLKELSNLISSYQSLKGSSRAVQIVNTIISTARQCNLDKDVELPEVDADELSNDERDNVVGKVYIRLMEIESRLLPCGLHVIGEPPTAEEAVATLVNIAALDRDEEGIQGLPGILAASVGRNIEEIYRSTDKGNLQDVQLLQDITMAARDAVQAFVSDYTGKDGRVGNVGVKLGSIFGIRSAEPWVKALRQTQFGDADQEKLRTVFNFLEFCLKQVVMDNEIGALKDALEGKYIVPGPGGDPIRNPKVLPTGKNIHALDPQAIPTAAALQSAAIVVDRLLERQKRDNGNMWPETIALVLWGTDNIKTYGESLAQVMWMVGVKPKPDALGRVNKLEVIPLEELGRPRIDVVVNCSGVFRDLFVNQMNLLDRAIKLVAELDEPEEMNFVRKHALEQAAENNVSLREAATRVYSNASGSYSSNVNLAVENSSWNDEKQLQEMYLTRKSFAFNSDAPGAGMMEKRNIFESALKTVDVTFQNLDSSEISLTDVSHYFDSDPTKLVQGLRTDGRKPSAYIADTTTANAQVRTLGETVRLDARTKLLNPKWYEGMMSSGYEGVREIEKRLTNTMGWSATSGTVDNWVYEEANETFIEDAEMQKRLLETNPNSFRKLVATFLEANGRGYWDTTEEKLEKLRQLYQEVEDRIEGLE
eukprot:jgi/Chlat1/4572/Chrsp29S04466